MRPNFKPSRFITFLKDTLDLIDGTVLDQFDKSLSVYVGHPGGAVGSQADTPFVVIIPSGDSMGQFQDSYSWSYTIAFCADGTSMDRDTEDLTSMDVVDKLTEVIDAFARELNDAILDRNITLAGLDSRWEFVDHPLTSCILEASFTMPNTLGISSVEF